MIMGGSTGVVPRAYDRVADVVPTVLAVLQAPLAAQLNKVVAALRGLADTLEETLRVARLPRE